MNCVLGWISLPRHQCHITCLAYGHTPESGTSSVTLSRDFERMPCCLRSALNCNAAPVRYKHTLGIGLLLLLAMFVTQGVWCLGLVGVAAAPLLPWRQESCLD